MVLTTAIASFILGVVPFQATTPGQKVVVHCPITGEEVGVASGTFDYKGVRYQMCCAGCPDPFKANPDKALQDDKLKGLLVGVGLFDPVSGYSIRANKAEGGSSDYNGVRYYFSSADDKTAFDADPKKFTTVPAKEVRYCPIMKHEVKSYDKSGGYADINGVRYYICCSECLAKLKADPTAGVAGLDDKASKPVVLEYKAEK